MDVTVASKQRFHTGIRNGAKLHHLVFECHLGGADVLLQHGRLLRVSAAEMA